MPADNHRAGIASRRAQSPASGAPKPADSKAASAQTASTPADNAAPGGNTQTPTPADGSKAPDKAGAIDWHADIRGLCTNVKTNFPGDEACIPAPPAGEGMQIHIGPSNWDDAEEVAKYVLHPGEESSECFTVRTPNDKAVVYQTSVLSGRAGCGRGPLKPCQ